MFTLEALVRSSLAIFRDNSSVALPRNDLAIHVSVSNSRNLTCESLGCGKWPKVLPDGITNETYHPADSELSAFWAVITGAVIAIFCEDLFPFEM